MKTENFRMSVRRIQVCLCLCGGLFAAISTVASERRHSYCFRLYLKDKGVAETAISSPKAFLSPEAIERRTKWNVEITMLDVPVSPACIELITATGVHVVTQSKWLSTVVVESDDSLSTERLKALPMVDSVVCVWRGEDRLTLPACSDDTSSLTPATARTEGEYGYAASQIAMLNGLRLHEAGRRGQGMRIAVIDAGFRHADRIDAFASLQLLGTCNMVFPGRSVFCEDDHGTKVLACLAAYLPGYLIGTAPEASYLLLKSEDPRAEYPLEEDYWAAAVEYADSVGVDIVTSSLGYYRFDLPDTVYRPSDLDGRTAFITRAAQAAADRGILVFCSAGNEGGHDWERITFPADAPDILTVGAITSNETLSNFSSKGFTADYRIKPDVVALGAGVCVVDGGGDIHFASGTSFSAPLVAGMGACLWQALPWLGNKEVINLIRRTASKAAQPDAEFGYGIPNIYKAYLEELHESAK